MRLLIQRVREAKVLINNEEEKRINKGLVVFVGIEDNDNKEDIEWLCNKLVNLRIFDDSDGIMNINVKDINGEILVISQFTLHASTKKGNRPSYIRAAKPEVAEKIYSEFINYLKNIFSKIKTGVFGAYMLVSLINDGPVTIFIDSKNKE